MTGVPDVKLEQYLGGSWVDLTDRVAAFDDWGTPMQITRGVGDGGTVTPGGLTLTLSNDDGELTPERAASSYYPHLTRYRPIRLSAYIAGSWRGRFTGYVDTEPLAWLNGPATECVVNLTCTDAIGLAGGHVLRSAAVEAAVARGPLGYWSLTDSDVVAEQSGNAAKVSLSPVQIGTEGEVAFASGVPMATDSSGGVVFTPNGTSGAVNLRSSQGLDLPASWALSIFPTPAAKDGYLVQIGTASYSLGIWYDTSTKKFSAIETMLDSSGDPIDYVLSTSTSAWAGGMETLTVTATTVKLGSSGTTGSRHNTDQMVGSLISVGGGMWVESGRAAHYSGAAVHMGLWSGTVPSGLADETTTGHADLFTMSTAISRLMEWAGVPVTVVTRGTDRDVMLAKTDGITVLDQLTYYAQGSLSRIFVDGDGDLVVVGWDYSAPTVTAPSGEINPALEWGADPNADVSQVVMTWPDGTVYTATDAVGAGSLDLPGVLTVADGQTVADWSVGAGVTRPRLAAVTYDLMTLPSADVLALAEVGEVLEVPGLPVQLPSTTEVGVVDIIVETLGVAQWDRQFTTSADSHDRVLLVGDATRGVVGVDYLAAPLGPETSGGAAWRASDVMTAANLNARGYVGGELQSGSLTITPTASTPTSQAVTFATAFATTPVVTIGVETNKPGSEVQGFSVTGVSTTGFTAWVYRTNTTPVVLHWGAAT